MIETIPKHTIKCFIANRKGWERLEYVDNMLILRCRHCGVVRDAGEPVRYSFAVDWGKVRFWTDRLSWYPQKVQWLFTFFIWLELKDLSYWWLLIAIPFIPLLFKFERDRVISGELSQYTHHNTALKDLIEKGKSDA